MSNQPYEFPSVRDVQNYARAITTGQRAPINSGQPMMTPYGGAKPRLRLNNQGMVTIIGADNGMAFMPPMQPLQPNAQAPGYDVIGRPWDYPIGYNTRVTPRSGMDVGFPMLKALADGYDVLRGMIERVKDKIVTKPWAILPRNKRQKKDARCEEIEKFLRSPDKMHTWGDWARMLLEQIIVYDAPALYVRRTYGNELYSLEVLDGSLISPKMMADGRLPPPDAGPAYQQVIKGLPAVDYIQPVPYGMGPVLDPDGFPFPELFYKPRNPRVDTQYGYGPVEQMITTITIALSREGYLAQYYTAGSTPDLLISTPEGWTSGQIAEFNVWWDSVLAGNLANRRGTKFLPYGATVVDTKEKALTDETDEWLTRIMCFFLGLNPMPFVKQMNKGQEKTHHDEAAGEGQEPWQAWFTDFFSQVIPTMWGYDDLEFRWEEEDSVDPMEQAQIDVMLVRDAKMYHPDELRAKRGDDPMPDDLRAEMDLATVNASANSTILPEDQQAARDAAAMELAASKPAPVMGPPGGGKPAEKTESVTHHHIKVDAPTINIAPPSVTMPSINVSTPPVNVTLPEMKASDVFVDVGATNVKVDAPQQQQGRPIGNREVAVSKNAKGELVGTITETFQRTVRVDGDGKLDANEK